MEERKFEIENGVGPDLKEIRLRYKCNNELNHYSEGMYSGPQIVAFAVDALTDFTVRRDNGDGSLLVNLNCNFRASLFAGDTIEVILWLEKDGTRSRTYGYRIYKVIANHSVEDYFEVLDPPVLVCDGTGTCVVKKPRPDQLQK